MATPFTDEFAEVDQFGNPIPPWARLAPPQAQGLPFDPGPTSIPQRIPDPATAGVNGILPPGQAPSPAPSPGLPPWLTASMGAANEVAQTPPWVQGELARRQQSMASNKPTAPEVDAISGGEMPPGRPESQGQPSGISRQPSLVERENQNIMGVGGVREERERQKSGVMDSGVSEQETLLNRDEAKRQSRQDAITAKREKLEADIEKYANGDVDTDRWYDRQGFASTVLYGVSAFLTGMAQPRSPNTMVNWIGQQIERDLAAQRTDMERRGNALSMRGNLLAQEVAQAGSMEAGEAAFRANRWALAQNKMGAIDQRFAAPEQRFMTQQAIVEAEKARQAAMAEYEMKVGKLLMEQDKEAFDRNLDVAKLTQQEAESRRSAGVQMRGQDLAYDTNEKDRAARLQAAEMQRRKEEIEKDQERGVANPATGKNVGRFTLGSKEEWVKAREAGQEYHRGKSAYEEYIALVKKGIKTPLSDQERKRAKSAYAEVVTNWKQAKQMGAWDKGLQTLGEQAIPPPIEIGGKSIWDIPGQTISAAIAEPTLALEDNARRLGPEVDAKFNALGYESADGRPFSETYAPIKGGATEGEGAADRASKTYDEEGRPLPPNVRPLEAPRIGR